MMQSIEGHVGNGLQNIKRGNFLSGRTSQVTRFSKLMIWKSKKNNLPHINVLIAKLMASFTISTQSDLLRRTLYSFYGIRLFSFHFPCVEYSPVYYIFCPLLHWTMYAIFYLNYQRQELIEHPPRKNISFKQRFIYQGHMYKPHVIFWSIKAVCIHVAELYEIAWLS